MAPDNVTKTNLLSDSLFMYWGQGYFSWIPPKSTGDTTIFKLEDIFDTELATVKTIKNWVLLDMGPFKKESIFTYRVIQSERLLFKRGSPVIADKINRQLEFLRGKPDRLFYELAIYQLNDLILDQQLVVYKILSQRKETSDPVLASYFKKLSDQYHFEFITFD